MKRIGIAASRMSQGNLVRYNCYVVLISFLFSLFMFIIAGSTVVFALIIIAYVGNEITSFQFEKTWPAALNISMVSLTILTAVFNLLAISRNLRLTRGSKLLKGKNA